MAIGMLQGKFGERLAPSTQSPYDFGGDIGKTIGNLGAIGLNVYGNVKKEEEAVDTKAKKAKLIADYNDSGSPTFLGLKGSARAERLAKLMAPVDQELALKYEGIATAEKGNEARLEEGRLDRASREKVAGDSLAGKQAALKEGSDEYVDDLLKQRRSALGLAQVSSGTQQVQALEDAKNLEVTLMKYPRGAAMLGRSFVGAPTVQPPPVVRSLEYGAMKNIIDASHNTNPSAVAASYLPRINASSLPESEKAELRAYVDDMLSGKKPATPPEPKVLGTVLGAKGYADLITSATNKASVGDVTTKAASDKTLTPEERAEIKRLAEERYRELYKPKAKTDSDIVDEVAAKMGQVTLGIKRTQFSLFSAGKRNFDSGIYGTAIQNFIKTANPSESVMADDINMANQGTVTSALRGIVQKIGFDASGMNVKDIATKLMNTAQGAVDDTRASIKTYGLTPEQERLFITRHFSGASIVKEKDSKPKVKIIGWGDK